jgi:hypothetical protein
MIAQVPECKRYERWCAVKIRPLRFRLGPESLGVDHAPVAGAEGLRTVSRVRILFQFIGAFLAAGEDLLAVYFDGDTFVIDIPIAHGALVHDGLLVKSVIRRRR